MAKKSPTKRYFTSIKNTFDFSRTEQRGIIVLCVILLLLIGYYFFLSKYYTEKQSVILTENPAIDSFLQQQQQYSDSVRASYRKDFPWENVYGKKGKQVFTPFHFCPDTMKIKDWQRLGFSEKQALQIEKYLSKGGKFVKKEDFKKLYCVSEETYQLLEPYIHISSSKKENERQEKPNLAVKSIPKLELNEADSIDLLKISGIGAKIASQIISYRSKLGGFVHIDQLKEVKFIDEERFTKIAPYLQVNNANIKKINVNEASISLLVKHPYIDYYLAKSIVNQRDKKGKYASLEEMKKALLIHDELYQKIAPYLRVE
jgi:competence ComEA-like helix-hairpin-helix protein